MSSLLNRSEVKKVLLAKAKELRSHPFTRVSKDALDWVEIKVLEACEKLVTSQPSKGKTICP